MNAIARSVDLRTGNRRKVLRAIRQGGVLSRTEISRDTRLSAATVTAIVSDLIDRGLVEPAGTGSRAATGRGRPKVDLSINPHSACVGTLVFKHDSISAALFDFAGVIIAENTLAAEMAALDSEALKGLFADCFAGLMARAPEAGPLRRLAVGVQGKTDAGGTRILWSPATPHRNLPLAQWLSHTFGVPVRVWNDCDMIANALHWREPDRYGVNFAAILLSYGVGMGLFIDGRPMNGTHSSGMEFGHMTYVPDGALCRCGRRGCIEAYAADYAMSRRAFPDAGRARGIEAVVAAARAGNADALAAIETAARALGTGLASLFALMDRLPVALVGSGVAAYEFMERPIRELLEGEGGDGGGPIDIGCFTDEMPIIHQGCAISALLALDGEITRLQQSRERSAIRAGS